jgi:2-polyprenyl-3-methyl-5-hydroxy-6-metoxy-1,4-benzoquinol methylase
MAFTEVHSCPLCGRGVLSPYLTCVDHLVTQEKFPLAECASCGLIITTRQPADPTPYYESKEYLSHQPHQTSLFARMYRAIRKVNLRRKVRLVQQHTQGIKLLDYGCGTGEFLYAAAQSGFDVMGVEPAPHARDLARSLTRKDIGPSISTLPADDRYDIITLWHVLEHVPDFMRILQELKGKLRAGGVILLALPNPASSEVSDYQAFWAGFDVPRHLWHFKPRTVEQLLQVAGLRLQATYPMKFDAYYVSLLSEQYRGGSRSIRTWVKAFVTGWRSNRVAKRTGQYSSLIYIARP